MFDSAKKPEAKLDPWHKDDKKAPGWVEAGQQLVDNTVKWAADSLAGAAGGLKFDPKQVRDLDLQNLFGSAFGDDKKAAPGTGATTAGATAAKADPAPAAITPVKKVSAAELKEEFTNNPRALGCLNKLTGDASFGKLSADDQNALLAQLEAAPNTATNEYLLGVAEYRAAKADDKGRDPATEKARLDKLTDRKYPDAGELSVRGVTYSIKDGKLLDKAGKEAGSVDNLGNYQLTGEKTPSNYYDDVHARVLLKEGEGKEARTLLDLHDIDPNAQLRDAGMNDTFVGKVESTLRSARREGMDMGVAPQGGFRSFKDQNDLYAKGRSRRGAKVTNAEGGESYHNYGIATDNAFYNAAGQITWPEQGDYAKLWTRYGELAKKQGLEWGGDWKSSKDRPHVEYHPGLNASQASTLKPSHARGGDEGAWDHMGIGEKPGDSDMSRVV